MRAESNWPREINLDSGAKIVLYQPQNETLDGNKLISRTVVSVAKNKDSEPVFGVFWSEAILQTDKDTRMATLESIKVKEVRFPDVTDTAKIAAFRTLIETEVPKWNLILPLDDIVATLEQEQTGKTDQYNTAPPEIIYKNKPSTLVIIDGEPKLKMDDQLKMERVINSPFLIIKNPDDKKFYLYAGKFWYASSNIESGWSVAAAITPSIKSLDDQLKKNAKEEQSEDEEKLAEEIGPTDIVVSTKPAELIQSDGEAKFSSVQGTGLLYVSNSSDFIFKNIEDQQYYILLSGRWYTSAKLEGPWSFIASDKLPADFAKIPEGSDMDAVLANVAGTDAAREAVMDAQIPQTAKVDRKTATCTVTYDGEPKFEKIEGTEIEVAVNSSVTVMRQEGKYYAVENGVWFISSNAKGPWTASDNRPQDIDKVPPSSEVYNTRYVYIYDVTPEYIYMGYTPGYMGCYVYGPTVIYGTGFYYVPWYGTVYYPRPVTYGFGVHYNPWYGWSMSFTVSYGFFSFSIGGYPGGWWGPPVYRPPYYRPPYPGYGGYYGHRPPYNHYEYHGGGNNIYINRDGVNTRDINRGNRDVQPRPSTQPAGTNRPSAATRDVTPQDRSKSLNNNVYSDKAGNVYRQDQAGNWEKRDQGNWQPETRDNNASPGQMDRSAAQRDRSSVRSSQATPSTGNVPSRSSYGGGSYGGGARSMGGGGGFHGGRR